MAEHLLILVSTVLANNFVLVRFLGLCPFMGVSTKLEGAIGMSVATKANSWGLDYFSSLTDFLSTSFMPLTCYSCTYCPKCTQIPPYCEPQPKKIEAPEGKI